MNACSGTGGAVPPNRVAEQLQRLADRAVRGRGRGGHLIVRVEPTDGSWCWDTVATGAEARATPVRPNTPFHLASVTKMYTAAIVLRLAAHGRLALTDPITAHLPAGLTHRLHVLDGHDRTTSLCGTCSRTPQVCPTTSPKCRASDPPSPTGSLLVATRRGPWVTSRTGYAGSARTSHHRTSRRGA